MQDAIEHQLSMEFNDWTVDDIKNLSIHVARKLQMEEYFQDFTDSAHPPQVTDDDEIYVFVDRVQTTEVDVSSNIPPPADCYSRQCLLDHKNRTWTRCYSSTCPRMNKVSRAIASLCCSSDTLHALVTRS